MKRQEKRTASSGSLPSLEDADPVAVAPITIPKPDKGEGNCRGAPRCVKLPPRGIPVGRLRALPRNEGSISWVCWTRNPLLSHMGSSRNLVDQKGVPDAD